jgi:hypothetical protein
MAKVLIGSKWYNEVAPTGIYESYYEMMVKTQAKKMWPRFHPVPFKANVYAGLGSGVKTDLALVEKSYVEWWVVEVEMDHHPFESHVLKQTRKLANAKYGDEEAAKLCEGCSELDTTKTKQMIKDCQPKVLVVVNKPKPEWAKKLAEFDAKVVVFEMFTDGDGDFVYRINGDHPIGKCDLISTCRPSPLMTRWLVVESPISLAAVRETEFSIEFNGGTTTWKRFQQESHLYLFTEGPYPLPDNKDFQLVRRGDGQLAFEAIPKGANP